MIIPLPRFCSFLAGQTFERGFCQENQASKMEWQAFQLYYCGSFKGSLYIRDPIRDLQGFGILLLRRFGFGVGPGSIGFRALKFKF